MTCPQCGRYAPPDPETGYNGDDFCSRECEDKYYDFELEQLRVFEGYQKENPNDSE